MPFTLTDTAEIIPVLDLRGSCPDLHDGLLACAGRIRKLEVMQVVPGPALLLTRLRPDPFGSCVQGCRQGQYQRREIYRYLSL